MSTVSSEDIDAFVQIFEASDWDEVDVAVGDLELHLSKTVTAGSRLAVRIQSVRVQSARDTFATLDPVKISPVAAQIAAVDTTSTLSTITAPHIGTYRSSWEPGAPPLVEIGQRIGVDTEVCVLNVMETHTALRAGIDGILREVRATDGQLVEGGEVLFLVEPSR